MNLPKHQSREEIKDIYIIRVHGHLDPRWKEWFDGFLMTTIGEDTVLRGVVPDQAALHGILAKIRDLGLPVLVVLKLIWVLENYENDTRLDLDFNNDHGFFRWVCWA